MLTWLWYFTFLIFHFILRVYFSDLTKGPRDHAFPLWWIKTIKGKPPHSERNGCIQCGVTFIDTGRSISVKVWSLPTGSITFSLKWGDIKLILNIESIIKLSKFISSPLEVTLHFRMWIIPPFPLHKYSFICQIRWHP